MHGILAQPFPLRRLPWRDPRLRARVGGAGVVSVALFETVRGWKQLSSERGMGKLHFNLFIKMDYSTAVKWTRIYVSTRISLRNIIVYKESCKRMHTVYCLEKRYKLLLRTLYEAFMNNSICHVRIYTWLWCVHVQGNGTCWPQDNSVGQRQEVRALILCVTIYICPWGCAGGRPERIWQKLISGGWGNNKWGGFLILL